MPKHPWTAIPATRSSAPILKIKFYAIIGGIGLLCLLSLISFIGFISAGSSSTPVVTGDVTPPLDRAFAEQIARDMLAARPTTLPVAEGVDPTWGASSLAANEEPVPLGVRDIAWSGSDYRVLNNRAYRVHSFLVRTDTDSYQLDVTTMRSTEGLPVLVAQPALGPVPQPATVPKALDYAEDPGVVDTVSADIRRVTTEWATAYATGDGETLRQISNDLSSATGDYVGLGGFEVVGEPRIVTAIHAGGPTMDLRIRVVFRSTGAKQYLMSNDFDLLVGDPDTSVPKVVAWGPAGSAIELTPYQNNTNSRGSTAPPS